MFPSPPSPSQGPQFAGTAMMNVGGPGVVGGGATNVMFNPQTGQQQQQMQRVQRQPSIPQGAQHLPGEDND